MNFLEAAFERVVRFFGGLATTALLIIVVVSVVDVLSRNLLSTGIPGVVEYAEILMVLMIYLGLAITQQKREHVSMSVLVDRLPLRVGAFVEATGMAVVSGIIAIFAYGAWNKALVSIISGEARFGLLAVQVWPARLAIAAGLTLFLFQFLIHFRIRLADIFRKDKDSTEEQKGFQL